MGIATSAWAQKPVGFTEPDTRITVMKPNGRRYYELILAQPDELQIAGFRRDTGAHNRQ